MNKIVVGNIICNLCLTALFVYLNVRALQLSLEETFVSLAVIYGVATVVANAVFIACFGKKRCG